MSSPVKQFLSILTRALRRARHFALVEGSAIPTKGSLVIVSGQKLSSTHASLRSIFDHDYYFELPSEGERDTQSITRCFTSHHRDFRVVPRANQTFSPARNPISCASSSKGEPPVFVPLPPWRFSVRAASSGGHTSSAIPEGCAPSLAPLPPAGNVIESSLVS
jgi:hypothetical protein